MLLSKNKLKKQLNKNLSGQFLSLQRPIKIFNMKLEAQEARVMAPLSPTLGQYGLACQEFCQKFNDKTKIFNAGIPLIIKFFVLPDKKFEFEINSILFKECLNFFFNDRKVVLLDLYKLFLIQKGTFQFQNMKILNIVLGSFKTFNLKKKLVLKQLKMHK